MNFKEFLNDMQRIIRIMIPILLGILVILASIIVPLIVSEWFRLYPPHIGLIVGIVCILIPFSVYILIFGIYRLKIYWPFLSRNFPETKFIEKKNKFKLLDKKYYKIFMIVFLSIMPIIGITTVGITFSQYWYSEINLLGLNETYLVILILSLFFIADLLISWELIQDLRDKSSFTFRRWAKNPKNKSKVELGEYESRTLHRINVSKTAATNLVLIILIVVGFFGVNYFTGVKKCNDEPGTFADPAYNLDLILSGTHENTFFDTLNPTNESYLDALEKALWAFTQLQRGGGFPLKSETDGSFMYSDRGESCALMPNEFSIQSGTAMVGGVYLRMYQIEPNPVYLSVAENVADALMAIQDEKNGGFYYDGRTYDDGTGYQPHPRNPARCAVLDDNVMQSCLNFLLDIYNETKESKYKVALIKGFDCLFDMEVEGGGWPQQNNHYENEYQSYVTLNDNTMKDVLMVMLKGYKILGEQRYLEGAKRAGDFLIRVQGNGGSPFQTCWAQQYKDDQPAWARKFEPYAMCSAQTGSAIIMLMELYLETNDSKFIQPIPDAINWLNSSVTTIPLVDDDGNPTGQYGWSRLYELITNKRIVGNRNSEGTDDDYYYEYIPERDYGYSWESTYGINGTMQDWVDLMNINYNTTKYLENREQEIFNSKNSQPISQTADLTSEGFWIVDEYITSSVFASKALRFIDYFEYHIKTV